MAKNEIGQVMEYLAKMDKNMNEGFKQIGERFDKVDRRFNQMDEQFKQVNERLNRIESEQPQTVLGLLEHIKTNTDNINKDIDFLSNKVARHDLKLNRFDRQ